VGTFAYVLSVCGYCGYVLAFAVGLYADKVFKEIAIISSRQYVATTINNERIYHCTKKSYDQVVNLAKCIK
jgi:hypothetical protein